MPWWNKRFGCALGASITLALQAAGADSSAGETARQQWFSPWMLIVVVFVLAVLAVMLLLRRELEREQAALDESAGTEQDERVSGHFRS
jgi:hypothetical protein